MGVADIEGEDRLIDLREGGHASGILTVAGY